MSAQRFYAAIRPSGKISGVTTSQRHARQVAAELWASGVNARKYGRPAPPEWRKAKAAWWSIQPVRVTF